MDKIERLDRKLVYTGNTSKVIIGSSILTIFALSTISVIIIRKRIVNE